MQRSNVSLIIWRSYHVVPCRTISQLAIADETWPLTPSNGGCCCLSLPLLLIGYEPLNNHGPPSVDVLLMCMDHSSSTESYLFAIPYSLLLLLTPINHHQPTVYPAVLPLCTSRRTATGRGWYHFKWLRRGGPVKRWSGGLLFSHAKATQTLMRARRKWLIGAKWCKHTLLVDDRVYATW